MARIVGKIESLKALRHELEQLGIIRFNSIKEIQNFQRTYNKEKNNIIQNTQEKLEIEFEQSKKIIEENIKIIEIKKEAALKNFNLKKSNIQNSLNSIYEKSNTDIISQLWNGLKVFYYRYLLHQHNSNKNSIINSNIRSEYLILNKNKVFVKEFETNKNALVNKRANSYIKDLKYTKEVISGLGNLISGAIGENMVVKEIKKLSHNYVLINDFCLSFHPPIYKKKNNDKIYSIQIDHLLISKAGIFILETKNWSKETVDSSNFRSPIEQIQRLNFALYVYISDKINLKNHHWGMKKIPIRNIIVMINNKPHLEFNYVKVLLLKELNNYIEYFKPILSDNEFREITDFLIHSNEG